MKNAAMLKNLRDQPKQRYPPTEKVSIHEQKDSQRWSFCLVEYFVGDLFEALGGRICLLSNEMVRDRGHFQRQVFLGVSCETFFGSIVRSCVSLNSKFMKWAHH